MSDSADSVRDDLAFLRALVSDREQVQASLGTALFAGGVCFGAQCIVQWTMLVTGWQGHPLVGLAAGILPTIIFLAVLARLLWSERNRSEGGTATRALNAAFGGTGLAALVTAGIFGSLAIRDQSITTWLFHPMMVCVMQGAAWYTAFAIRRSGWMALVSFGWFVTAIILAFLMSHLSFVLVMGVSLLLFMALPGWVLMRTAAAPD